ncbi:YkgJ family cysteine cluster protein [Dokdonella sp.]|uniref:YkgJ family cysteine cluster protein n=1 Tax=Dokdonella sp. TaxID=2291710 RepID=UPI00261BD9FE|nr:YkgJ family cysteine cluster protein [Dokdonella sp.]
MSAALAIDVVDDDVHCARCEAVCCRLPVLLMPDDDVPPWLTGVDEHGLEHMIRREDGWCAALDRDTMRCTIYERRPWICGEFAMGGSDCRAERADWRGDAHG